jgi:dipeptidyl aminopeptidase/acylaminoacyl peptidase
VLATGAGAAYAGSMPRPSIAAVAAKLVASSVCVCFAAGAASETPVTLSKPEIFGAGVISGPANNSDPAFVVDCRSVVFGRSNGSDAVILIADAKGRGFHKPQLAPFSGRWRDLEPTASPDGHTFAFASNRPAEAGGKALDGNWGGKVVPEAGGNLWYVERKGDGWSEPRRYPDAINSESSVFSPSLTARGALYFMKPTHDSGRFHIYRTEIQNAEPGPIQRLPFNLDERWSDVDPTVAPDESFVVFSSNRPPAATGDMDLFIVFRAGDGWGEPLHLGPVVNSASGEIEARLAPDGHTLYFSSRRTMALTFPKSKAFTAESLAQMEAWGNGLSHIWRVDLAPVLAAHGVRPSSSSACPRR